MDQVYTIRHKVLVEGQSVREVARELGISRNTIRRYLDVATVVGERAPAARPQPVHDRVRPRLEEILAESATWTGGKQRLTVAKALEILRGEGLVVGETVVKQIIREWRRRRREVFVPLTYHPGDLAEVDFFEVLVDVAEVRQKAWMFLLRLMHTGRDFAWIYPRQDQVCFLDGHVRAFAHLGGVPRRLLFDNLRPAVARILAGSERVLAARFAALATHYVFEPCFARPATGHDKGGVEARGKGIRWQHLVPIPRGPDLATISAALLARLDAAAAEDPIRTRFEAERAQLVPLPQVAFRAAATHVVPVSRRSLITVAGAAYSVPCAWSGLEVTAHVGVDTVEVVGPSATVVHARRRPGERAVDYRHYVRELARKPQAVRQVATDLVRDLGEPFGAVWHALVEAHGPAQAARLFAKVLGALETHGEVAVRACLARALAERVPPVLALGALAPPPTLVAPAALPHGLDAIEVAGARATDYDALLGGAR